ncbi:MAG TPA: DUF883 C-terminal domain-containing protein [Methylomirabilota bacterium]|nr:DUF883 C-terminal domain-containing protein [Methylomirabilota bacterium]
MDERRMESMGDTAARASSAMQNRLNRVSERAQDYVSDAGDQLSQIRGSMGPYLEQARRFVQDRPLQAIALTIGLGFVLGKLIGRD